jgi:hypothetical protein
MYMDLLNSNCFPTWPVVFAIAEKSLTSIRDSDPDFYNHLKMISKINVKVNPKVCFFVILLKLFKWVFVNFMLNVFGIFQLSELLLSIRDILLTISWFNNELHFEIICLRYLPPLNSFCIAVLMYFSLLL